MGETASVPVMESVCVEDGPGGGHVDSKLLETRQRLLVAVKLGSDCSTPLIDLLHLPCAITMKYAILNVRDILQNNNQSIQSLRNIPVALNILEKYGRHLIKPKTVRNELWRYVKFSNPIYRERVEPLQGGRELMKVMGYTEDIEDGLYFPEPSEPDMDATANLVVDILLARKEMEMYLSGSHPNPSAIEQFLPHHIVSDVQMLRVGVNLSDLSSTHSPAGSSQTSSVTHPPPPPAGQHPAVMSPTQSSSNAQGMEQSVMKMCDICGDAAASMLCTSCDCKLLCASCDDMWHKHPRRLQHQRVSTAKAGTRPEPNQTNTIQGPYGIQVRPPRESVHHMQVSPAPHRPAALAAPAAPAAPAQDLKTEEIASSPNKTLTNVPCLSSLVEPNMVPVSQFVATNTNTKMQSPQPFLQPYHKPPQPSYQQQPGPQGKQSMHPPSLSGLRVGESTAPSEPVYFPPDNISFSVFSPSMPSQTVKTCTNLQSSVSIRSSKLIAKIKEEKNTEKQIAKCEIHILSLIEEIEDIEKQLNTIIETSETFYEDEQFMNLNRKKGLMVREKKHLEIYRQELEHTRDLQEEPLTSPKQKRSDKDDGSRSEKLPPGFSEAIPTTATGLENLRVAPQQQPAANLKTPDLHQYHQYHQHIAQYMGSLTQPQPPASQLGGSLTQPQHPASQLGGSLTQPLPPASKLGGSVALKQHKMTVPVLSQLQDVSMQTKGLEGQESAGGGLSGASTCESTGHRHRWQCQHCTMFNVAGTRICEMCHKTTDQPVYVDEKTDEEQGLAGPQFPHTDPGLQAAALPNVGSKIAQEQDQVYWEKREAHRLYQERLKTESLGISTTGVDTSAQSSVSKMTEESKEVGIPTISTPSKSVTEKQLDPVTDQNKQPSFQETMEIINEQRHVKKTQLDGADMLQIIKTADVEGYEMGEIELALHACDGDPRGISTWLSTTWPELIDKVVDVVQRRSMDYEQNSVGQLSTKEAKEALQDTQGNVESAAAQCINTRIKLFADVNGNGVYAREDVLEAMHQHEGCEEQVVTHLVMGRLLPYRDRIWQTTENREPDVMHLTLNTNCNSISTSVISHQDFQARVCNKDIDLDRRIRMVLVEGRLQSWGRADTVIKILEQDLVGLESENDYLYTLEDVVEAVRNCQDRRSSLVYLQRDCVICMSKFPMTKMMNLNICQCQMCRQCLRRHFEISIKEKHVRNWTCPMCCKPDFNEENVAADYLNLLGLMLKTFVSKDILDLFETKVRDWYLQKDPNFRWCAHCGNGFLYQGWQEGGHLAMTCQHCRHKTCFMCKKQWEAQHEGLTCEQFEQWKIDNDPKNQAAGLAKHLEESGIDCPSCKMRYSLAKGGCMHFKCPQCAHEFCSGCSQPFYKKGTCSRFNTCGSQGLHCHHPRDCFFYLRDNSVEQLQKLLKMGEVVYNTEAGEEMVATCPVMEQKDGEVGSRTDEACGKAVFPGNAGLCGEHYKEYLVTLINRSKLDPVLVMSHEEMLRIITRMEMPLQERQETETQTQYKKRLLAFIQKKIPLKR